MSLDADPAVARQVVETDVAELEGLVEGVAIYRYVCYAYT